MELQKKIEEILHGIDAHDFEYRLMDEPTNQLLSLIQEEVRKGQEQQQKEIYTIVADMRNKLSPLANYLEIEHHENKTMYKVELWQAQVSLEYTVIQLIKLNQLQNDKGK